VKGLVHRDVCPRNICVKEGKEGYLIDWAFSVANNIEVTFQGTITFASRRVLELIQAKKPFVYRPEDDLHSLVRTIVYMKELQTLRSPPPPTELEKLYKFWTELHVPNFRGHHANI